MASFPFLLGFTPIVLSTAGRAKFRAGFCSAVSCRFTRFIISTSESKTLATSRFLRFSGAAVVVVVVVAVFVVVVAVFVVVVPVFVVVVPVFVVVVAVFVVVDAVLVAPSKVVV